MEKSSLVTLFPHCGVQSLPTVVVRAARCRHFAILTVFFWGSSAIHRDLDDTGIVTFGITIEINVKGIAILTEVSQEIKSQ